MKTRSTGLALWLAACAAFISAPRASAEEPDADRITEQDKQVFKDIKETIAKQREAAEMKDLQIQAVMSLRQIGLAMFEFETEYGEFPCERTADEVKKNSGTSAEVKAATSNDCFFQLMAAGIVDGDRFFSIGKPAAPPQGEGKMPDKLRKCSFSYFTGMNAAGHPGRPLVIAPLVKGKPLFDPAVLGGKAVVLRVDNSVQTFPIDKDGRVRIDGKDLFDPAQPFWGGKVPAIRWPEE